MSCHRGSRTSYIDEAGVNCSDVSLRLRYECSGVPCGLSHYVQMAVHLLIVRLISASMVTNFLPFEAHTPTILLPNIVQIFVVVCSIARLASRKQPFGTLNGNQHCDTCRPYLWKNADDLWAHFEHVEFDTIILSPTPLRRVECVVKTIYELFPGLIEGSKQIDIGFLESI